MLRRLGLKSHVLVGHPAETKCYGVQRVLHAMTQWLGR